MPTNCTTDIAIAAPDSAAFARLSGDFNPLHLDPVAARRTPFGGTVVHGIHLLLASLDRTAAAWASDGLAPDALSVVFNNPVPTGSAIRATLTCDPAAGKMRLACTCAERTAFSGTIELGPATSERGYEPDDVGCVTGTPRAMSFPPAVKGGEVALHLDRGLLAALFPALARMGDLGWIADLLASTRIVGMECPGADSIFSACRLRRIAQPAGRATAVARFTVERADERFRSVRLSFGGTALEGTVEALFRAGPVAQMTLRELCATIPADAFRAQRALIVGGSRGLGELTAKLVMAGGGDVTLTYSRGRTDAERIRAEAGELGRRCDIERLDVLAGAPPDWLARPFTHVYFFASPAIAKNATGRWDHALFESMASVYLRAFATLAHALMAAPRAVKPRLFYPSSIFVTRCESGFAEYGAAKAAGEALCAQLERQYGTLILRPRLPRMRTDQTSGVRDSDVEDSLAVMRECVSAMQATPDGAAR